MKVISMQRAKYIALKDFSYRAVIGMAYKDYTYQKGDTMTLRIEGRMAVYLLSKRFIKHLELL